MTTQKEPLPYWPALLRRSKAEAYCDLTAGKFEMAIAEGKLPYPIWIAGQERWRRAEIDQYIEDPYDRDWLSKTPLARGEKI